MTTKRKIASWYDVQTCAYLELTEVTPDVGTVWYDIDANNITLESVFYYHVYIGCYHTIISAMDAVTSTIREACRYGQILEQTREFRYA